MNPFLAKAIVANRKIGDGDSLDALDAEIIDIALKRLIREGRVPFQRFRDHFIIGTERWKELDGLDYYRTILLHRKSDVWYPDSEMSQLSPISVYAASQVEPPDQNVFDEDRGKPLDYAFDLLGPEGEDDEFGSKQGRRAHIGATAASSYQKIFEEAPPDWRIKAIGTVQQNLRKYVRELSNVDSILAQEKRDTLEVFLRARAKSKTDQIGDGEIESVTQTYLQSFFYRGAHRAIRGPSRKIYDSVRSSCKYALEVLIERGNPMTGQIAQHLKDYVVIGQPCEYKGDWKWRF